MALAIGVCRSSICLRPAISRWATRRLRLDHYNGECYNYASSRTACARADIRFRSTSEPRSSCGLYEARGECFLDEIEGMFALAIWDGRRQRLLVARDRLGIKPLFYYAGPRASFCSPRR